MTRSFHYILGVIAALSIALKIWYLYYMNFAGIARFPDELNYYLGGAQLLRQQGLSYFLTERSLWNAPLNILWVALFQSNVLLIQIINCVVVSLSSCLFAYTLRNHLGTICSLILAAILAVHPGIIEFSATVLSEPLFLSLMLIGFSVWFLWNMPIGAGVFFALACLTRPSLLVLPFCLLAAVIILRRLQSVLSVTTVLKFSLGFYLLVGTFIGKNYIRFGAPVIAYGSGAVLYLGNDFKKGGDEPVYSGMDFDTIEITRPYTHLDKIGDERLREAALKSIKTHPRSFVALTLEKAVRLLFGYPSAYFYPKRYWPVEQLYELTQKDRVILFQQFLSVVLTTFIGLGFLLGWARTRHSALIACSLLLSVYFLGLHSFLFAIPRMILPAVPFLLAVALLSFCALRRRNKIAFLIVHTMLVVVMTNYGRFVNYQIVPANYKEFLNPEQTLPIQTSPKAVKNQANVAVLKTTFKTQTVYRNTIVLIDIESLDSGVISCVRFFTAAPKEASQSHCFPLVAGKHIYRLVLQKNENESFSQARLAFKNVAQPNAVKINEIFIGT